MIRPQSTDPRIRTPFRTLFISVSNRLSRALTGEVNWEARRLNLPRFSSLTHGGRALLPHHSPKAGRTSSNCGL